MNKIYTCILDAGVLSGKVKVRGVALELVIPAPGARFVFRLDRATSSRTLRYKLDRVEAL